MFNLGRKSFFRTGWVNMEAIFELRLDYRDMQILHTVGAESISLFSEN